MSDNNTQRQRGFVERFLNCLDGVTASVIAGMLMGYFMTDTQSLKEQVRGLRADNESLGAKIAALETNLSGVRGVKLKSDEEFGRMKTAFNEKMMECDQLRSTTEQREASLRELRAKLTVIQDDANQRQESLQRQLVSTTNYFVQLFTEQQNALSSATRRLSGLMNETLVRSKAALVQLDELDLKLDKAEAVSMEDKLFIYQTVLLLDKFTLPYERTVKEVSALMDTLKQEAVEANSQPEISENFWSKFRFVFSAKEQQEWKEYYKTQGRIKAIATFQTRLSKLAKSVEANAGAIREAVEHAKNNLRKIRVGGSDEKKELREAVQEIRKVINTHQNSSVLPTRPNSDPLFPPLF